MASAQSIGTLTLDLQAKTATLESDLGKAQRITEQRMQAIQKSAEAAGQAIGTAIAAGFGIAVAAVKNSLDQFDQFSKAAQKVGVGTDQFSALAYAAKLSDVSVEDLTSTLAKLAKNQVAAAQGNAEMADNFKSIGINVKNADGSLRSTNEVFGDLADLFQQLPDGAQKTAIAIALLGKSGANAIPLLNGGRDSLKELSDQATAFGLVVDKQTGKAAEDFNDNLTKLGSAAEGLGAQLTKELLPSLVAFSNQAVDAAQKGEGLAGTADTISEGFKGVVTLAVTVKAILYDVSTVIIGLGDAIGRFYKIAQNNGNSNPFKNIGIFGLGNAAQNINDFFKGGDASQVAGNVSGGFTAAAKDRNDSIEAIYNPDKINAAASLAKANKEIQDSLDGVGKASSATQIPLTGLAQRYAEIAAKGAEFIEAGVAPDKVHAYVAAQNELAKAAQKHADDFVAATGKREAATKAQAAADRAARQAQKEALDLDDRVSKDANSMTAELQKQADTLYKSTVPGLDAYNDALQRINQEGAKFLKDATNKITGVIRPEDESRIDKWVVQMQALAKATLDAAAAANALAERNKTLDLEAQASDAVAASQGLAGLAVEANNYAKQVAELEQAYENNSASDATEQYQRQRAALDTLHDLRVQSIKSDYDDTSKFIKAGAQTLQDAIADALGGDGFKNGIKGFLDGIGDALRKAAAQIVAADLGKYLFGNAQQTGQAGGLLGNLFAGSNTSSGTSGSSGSGSFLTSIGSFFGSLFKAEGGPAYSGQGYIVGEEGPEWFQPPSNGTIVPNRALPVAGSAGGRAFTQVNNFQTIGRIDRSTQEQQASKAGLASQRAIARNR